MTTSILRLCLAGVLLVQLAGVALAADCRRTASVCVDASPSKVVEGLVITVDQVGGCWQFQDTYECLGSPATDYCAGIRQIAGCNQTNSTCAAYAFNGSCLRYVNTYRCGDPLTDASGIVQLDTTYTVTTDTVDRSQCAGPESNQSCTLASEICTEPGETRNINGLDVYKDCWAWQRSYSCVAQDYHDYCIPLRQTAGCSEVSSTCQGYAWNNTCNAYERTYRCDGQVGDPLPTNVTLLDTSYTIVSDTLDTAACAANAANPNCTLASHTCTQPGETRNINGLDVYKDCWEWTDEYVCASTAMQSDCAELEADGTCTQQSSTCVDRLPDGSCGLLERTFQCKITDEQSQQTTTCNTGVCVDGVCTSGSAPADTDFAGAVTGLEAGRELGMYMDPATLQIFKGEAQNCTNKFSGIGNCCKARVNVGGSNSSNSLMFAAIKYFGNEGVRFLGSSYMYDALYSTDLVPTELLAWMYSGGEGTDYSFGQGSVSFYGVTFSYGADGFQMGFDPYSFAIAVAIHMIMEYLKCEPTEQVLALKRQENLCHYVGSYCGRKAFGSCVEKKESYCCFNSRLARMINEQGRTQLSMSWGSAQTPDCSGFTIEQLQQLDFSRMDLSEFYSEIVPKNLDTDALRDRVRGRVNGYFPPGG